MANRKLAALANPKTGGPPLSGGHIIDKAARPVQQKLLNLSKRGQGKVNNATRIRQETLFAAGFSSVQEVFQHERFAKILQQRKVRSPPVERRERHQADDLGAGEFD